MRRLQNEALDKSSVIRELSRITKDKDEEIERLRSRRTGKQFFTLSPLRVLLPFLTPISHLEIELELGSLQTKDQEKTVLFNEAVRIANKNAEDIKIWEERYAKTISSHDEEIKKLDSLPVALFWYSSSQGVIFV